MTEYSNPDPNWKWVHATTKPLFLKSEEDRSRIVIPMRMPPGLDTCSGIIAITERPDGLGTLTSEMVRPLRSLGDTFGGMSRTQQ